MAEGGINQPDSSTGRSIVDWNVIPNCRSWQDADSLGCGAGLEVREGLHEQIAVDWRIQKWPVHSQDRTKTILRIRSGELKYWSIRVAVVFASSLLLDYSAT